MAKKKICLTLMAKGLPANAYLEEFSKQKFKDMEYHHCNSLEELLKMSDQENVGGIMVDPLFVATLAKRKTGYVIDVTQEHDRLVEKMKALRDQAQFALNTVRRDENLNGGQIVALRKFAHDLACKVRASLQPQ